MKRSWNGAAREHDLPVCGLGIATPSASEKSVRGVDLVTALVTPTSARMPLVRPPALHPGDTVALLKPSRPRRPADIWSLSGGVPSLTPGDALVRALCEHARPPWWRLLPGAGTHFFPDGWRGHAELALTSTSSGARVGAVKPFRRARLRQRTISTGLWHLAVSRARHRDGPGQSKDQRPGHVWIHLSKEKRC